MTFFPVTARARACVRAHLWAQNHTELRPMLRRLAHEADDLSGWEVLSEPLQARCLELIRYSRYAETDVDSCVHTHINAHVEAHIDTHVDARG